MGRHGNQNSAGTVDTAAIIDAAVTEAKIAADAVTTSKIKDGEIVNADVSASAAIAGTKVDAGTSTTRGALELATDAETVTGTDTARATTPANITAKLAEPGAIGGTTASTGAFTTLTASSTAAITGAASLDGGFDTGDDVTLKMKTIDIGDWNMDSTTNVSVAHGLTLANIRFAHVTVRKDSAQGSGLVFGSASATDDGMQCWVDEINATDVILYRITSGRMDTTTYDETSYNRGWIHIWYTA